MLIVLLLLYSFLNSRTCPYLHGATGVCMCMCACTMLFFIEIVFRLNMYV